MTDPLSKMTEQGDLLGKIRGFLSGFVGYLDRETRREADRVLRGTVARRLGTVARISKPASAGLVVSPQVRSWAAAPNCGAFVDWAVGPARWFFDAKVQG
jgi:hypothetical protein